MLAAPLSSLMPPLPQNPLPSYSAVNLSYPSLTGLKIANEAGRWWNQSSANGPDGGNLACAFMVNEILQRVIGYKYGLDPDTVNSVRTDLLRRGGRLVPFEQAQPGDLALSFNEASLRDIGGGTAHIGIFLTPSLIIANSSKNRRFNQIVTPSEFSRLYPYFEVIRPVESMFPTQTLSYWA